MILDFFRQTDTHDALSSWEDRCRRPRPWTPKRTLVRGYTAIRSRQGCTTSSQGSRRRALTMPCARLILCLTGNTSPAQRTAGGLCHEDQRQRADHTCTHHVVGRNEVVACTPNEPFVHHGCGAAEEGGRHVIGDRHACVADLSGEHCRKHCRDAR